MKKYVFLDTNCWIYLSNGFNIRSKKVDDLHLKVFSLLKQKVNEDEVVILTNVIVIKEWENNKEHAEKRLIEIQNNYTTFIKDFEIDTENLGSILESKFKNKIEKHKSHIDSVEDLLLNKSIKVKITDKVKLQAVDLALEKKAPFTGDKKNSMADALIFLSTIDFIFEQRTTFPFDEEYALFPDSFFVSSNKGDFSSKSDENKIHPDLQSFINRTNTKFSFSIADLIKELETKPYLTKEEEEFIENIDFESQRENENEWYCPECDFEHWPTIEFSEYQNLFDPNKYTPPNQLQLQFPDYEFDEPETEDISTKVRLSHCTNCHEDFLECACGELVHLDKIDNRNVCDGCGTIYRSHYEYDRKRIPISFEIEIVKEHACKTCGSSFENINESGNCENCAELEKKLLL